MFKGGWGGGNFMGFTVVELLLNFKPAHFPPTWVPRPLLSSWIVLVKPKLPTQEILHYSQPRLVLDVHQENYEIIYTLSP